VKRNPELSKGISPTRETEKIQLRNPIEGVRRIRVLKDLKGAGPSGKKKAKGLEKAERRRREGKRHKNTKT